MRDIILPPAAIERMLRPTARQFESLCAGLEAELRSLALGS